jgi:hypothetical protein
VKLYEEFKEYELMWSTLQEDRSRVKANRPTPEKYFELITSSHDAVVNFIREKIAPYFYTGRNTDFYPVYYLALGKETNERHTDIVKHTEANVTAFINKIKALYGLNVKDIYSIINLSDKTPRTKLSADELFSKITSTRESAVQFILDEVAPYKETSSKFDAGKFYDSAFGKATTLTYPEVYANNKINYRAFLNSVEKFNLTQKDVVSLIRTGEPTKAVDSYFNEITASRAAAFQFIDTKLLPAIASHGIAYIKNAYTLALARETNVATTNILKDTRVNYSAFINKLKDLSISRNELFNRLTNNSDNAI